MKCINVHQAFATKCPFDFDKPCSPWWFPWWFPTITQAHLLLGAVLSIVVTWLSRVGQDWINPGKNMVTQVKYSESGLDHKAPEVV